MSKRAASSADDGETPNNKLRRIMDAKPPRPVSLSFLDLKDDCLVSALSYLTYDDMNSFAMASRRCRDIRSHESLDQTRLRTIIITEEHSSILSVVASMKEKQWDRVFSSNKKTHLKIVGLEKLNQAPAIEEMINVRSDSFRLQGVTILDISYSPQASDREVDSTSFYCLFVILPDLREVEMSNVESNGSVSFPFGTSVARLVWNGAASFLGLDGESLMATKITNLSVDGCEFDIFIEEVEKFTTEPSNDGEENCYMWMKCHRLERLSMKGARCCEITRHIHYVPVPQAMLIKMVRHHPTLRWLRSDLTEENVAMLKEERPEITFVSE